MHILLGSNAEQNISRIKEYIIKYSDEYIDENGRSVSDFLQFFLLTDEGKFLTARKKTVESDVFISGIENEYAAELVESDIAINELSQTELRYFFTRLFDDNVNMQNRGDGKLHICIHFPLFAKENWERAEMLISAINDADRGINYTVDIMLTAADLAHLYISNQNILMEKAEEFKKTAADTLEKIVETKRAHRYNILNNIILVTNRNENGIALNLNHDSYANLIGEYALATAAYYGDIYPPTFLMATMDERPILGLGISMLHFDKFYFVQYLLRKAYSYILQREGLDTKTVDVNVVAPIVQDIIGENTNVFTAIYEQEVKPRLERNLPQEQIRAEIHPIIVEKINGLKRKFLDYLKREDLGLPEKRAILAQLLGEDDTILSGRLVGSENYSIIDECRLEALDNFVNANNSLLNFEETIEKPANGNEENTEVTETTEHTLKGYAALSHDKSKSVETAREKLGKIKKKRNEIKTSAAYIRNLTDQLNKLDFSLKTEDESHTRLTKEGFVFEGKTYYLMPKDIEVPLDETYEPSGKTLATEVDLRKQFTPIKSQGSLGSCTAFALVSIYEHILKKNEKKDTDLSELFAYHNARKRRSDMPMEEGSTIYDVVMGMGENGICLETFHKYLEEDSAEPSAEAYADAQKRKITKALNVERKIDHIKAAVSEGYPVAISLCIFESFASTTGIIPLPTEEEQNNENAGYHAMVICGYSDTEKVFIVRNSWGTDFGDKGYCYIPYSYIGDNKYLNYACIITEISLAELHVGGLTVNTPIAFNKEDNKVLAALLKNQIEEENIHLEEMQEELVSLRNDYLDLVTSIGNPSTQQAITNGSKLCLEKEIGKLNDKRVNLINERRIKIDTHDENKTFMCKTAGIIFLAVIAIYSLLYVYIEEGYALWYLDKWGVLRAFQVAGIAFLAIFPYLRKNVIEGIPEELHGLFNSDVAKMWKWWGTGIFVITATYLALALYKVIEQPLNIGTGWQVALTALCFVPFACLFFIHKGIGKQIEVSYDEKQKKIDLSILQKERLKENLETDMYVSSEILDKVTGLITDLNDTYSYMYSYVENLRIWYQENEVAEELPQLNRQPFMSLTDNRCLDNFFNDNKNNITEGIKLYELFDGYNDMSENGIIALKNSLKAMMKVELMEKTADFSIFEHATGRREYPYVSNDYVDLNTLLQTMDCNSEIFVQLANNAANGLAQNTKCKLLFRYAPDNNDAQLWDNSVHRNFNTKPVMKNIASKYKIFIIRLEGLSKNDIVMLRN